MSLCIVASCTPCVGPTAVGVDQIRREAASDTSSCCGHLVILMRRRSSATSASGKLTWNERIAVLSGMACSCGIWVEGDWAGVAAGEYAGNRDATAVAAVSLRPSRRVVCPRAVTSGCSTQRLERRSELLRENLRLLPGGEVPTLFSPAVVNEFGVGPLRPAPRSLILLSRKHGHCHRDRDTFDVEKAALVLPIETRCGD